MTCEPGTAGATALFSRFDGGRQSVEPMVQRRLSEALVTRSRSKMKHRKKAELVRDNLVGRDGLHATLQEIFPDLKDFSRESIADGFGYERWEDVTLHAILQNFHWSLSGDATDDFQIKQLARLIEISLSVKDDLENAWMTCFIEAGISKQLWSHLSREAKVHIKTN
jgi:hypothetical protein